MRVEFWNFEFLCTLSKENQHSYIAQTIDLPNLQREFFMKFCCHYFMKQWLSLLFQIEWLYLTYGIMFGGGSSLTYTPSIVILGQYFKRYLGMVNGFVATGCSVFTIVMPHILESLLSNPNIGVSETNKNHYFNFHVCLFFLYPPSIRPPLSAKN